ncbi:LysR substrate-binding domain-containing protein [Pseudomonas mosselii]|jgi:LysR family glycine cleavage system transcriptional activator|uniref:LysR substrate-binding domain-containing protein n=1 Tax=unclassified Pseudomonas TaxID=196821 RepID=UPI0020C26B0B|nr:MULTISPECIES: LysR substrate-binding domain-containing protein [unclassified Pseudomonas]MCP8633687.1 LysR substrate-binding domain-containing protein [Pseudomonas sp. DVZ6]MDD7785073.1 LysR substrate-binding domain-containing protein [Pseudomonas sp. DVZ24]
MGAVLPLLALRAFSETTRLGSLKAAAERMGVTPGAISQQIRLLEDRLGVTLLTRSRYGVQLTEAGASLYPGLSRGFGQIESALLDLQVLTRANTLTISTQPSFASSWLVPRLADFNALHPEIDVQVQSTAELVDLHREPVDIALRHGLGDYPGLESIPLLAPVLLPVASPGLLAGGPVLEAPQDCLHYPLLQDADRADWTLWLQAHGVEPDHRSRRGPSFDEDLLLVRAAVSGQGIALVQAQHAEEDLRSGRLVVALDRAWPSRFAYYLVGRGENMRRVQVRAFVEWIQARVEAEMALGGRAGESDSGISL